MYDTNNEKVEKEIKETIPFTIATKRIKYLGIYLPKEIKDLYIENYKTLVKGLFKHYLNYNIYNVLSFKYFLKSFKFFS